MIIRTLCSSRKNCGQLIDYRRFSSLRYAKTLNVFDVKPNSVNSTSCMWNRNVSSISSVTFPSWFVTLSNSPPVACAQQFVISFHEMTGTPWWASIVLCAVTLRLAITLPLTAYQVDKQIYLILNNICLHKLFFKILM